jgi:hypothetical protein
MERRYRNEALPPGGYPEASGVALEKMAIKDYWLFDKAIL